MGDMVVWKVAANAVMVNNPGVRSLTGTGRLVVLQYIFQ